MARVIENNCVGCGIPCINCGRKHQEVVKCDTPNCDEYAKYIIDGEDFCEDCAEEILVDKFKDLTIIEMAEALGIKISRCK
jgi:hypothetical protein